MKKTIAIFFLCPVFSCCAQSYLTREEAYNNEQINTDRPDQSDGVYTMHKGYMQVETGIVVAKQNQYLQALTHTSMLRYGLVDRIELRLEADYGMINDQYYHTDAPGVYPIALCSKIAVAKHKGLLPDITLSGYVRFPFASTKTFRPQYYSSIGLIVLQYPLGQKFSLTFNGGVSSSAVDKSIAYPYTTALVFQPTNNLGLFSEYFATYQTGSLPSNNADVGFLYTVKPNMQVDVAAGLSLIDPSNTNFITVGFSYRFNQTTVIVDYGR